MKTRTCLLAVLLAVCCLLSLAARPAQAQPAPTLPVAAPGASALTVRVGDLGGGGTRVPVVAHLASKAGQPAVKARITFLVDGARDGEAETDASGDAAWRLRRDLTAGTHYVAVDFAGSADLAAAYATTSLVVVRPVIGLQIPTPAPDGSTAGTLVAHLTGSGGKPLAGMPVALFVDGTSVAEAPTDATGNVTWRPKQEPGVGVHALKAVFAGAPLLLATQASGTLTVQATTLQLQVAPASPVQSDQAPLVAHLTTGAGAPLAQARITFLVDGVRDGEADTDANGNAAWHIRADLATGAHTVEAVFAGRTTLHSAHASAPLTVEVTTLAIQVATTGSGGGRAPVIVHLNMGSGPPVAGARITFLVDGTRAGEARTDAGGQTTWRLPDNLAAGAHTVDGVFDGTAGLRPARATTPYGLAPSTLQVHATPDKPRVGLPFSLAAQLSDGAGQPITNTRVTFLVDGVRDGEARTDGTGTATWRLRRVLTTGSYTVEAVFDGAPGALPARATLPLTVAPAAITIQTVPALTGVRFALDDQIVVSDKKGAVQLTVDKPGTYRLKVLPWEEGTTGLRMEFARWSDDIPGAERDLIVPSKDHYQVGFNVSYLVHPKFVDLQDQPIDARRVTTFTLTSNNGKTRVSDHSQALWLAGSRVIRQPQGLEESRIAYAVESVMVDGSNAVNQAQQRFTPALQQEWPIHLMFYSLQLRARDAFFGFPLGKQVRLQYPDGHSQTLPLEAQAEVGIAAVARGEYKASVLGVAGLAPVTPVIVSQNTTNELLVLSVVDLGLMVGIGICFVLGLLIFGRPRLLRLAQQYAAAGTDRVPGARRLGATLQRPLAAIRQGPGRVLAGGRQRKVPADTSIYESQIAERDAQIADLTQRLENAERERQVLQAQLDALAPVPPPAGAAGGRRGRDNQSKVGRPSGPVPYASQPKQ